jgi:hypothetical protein
MKTWIAIGLMLAFLAVLLTAYFILYAGEGACCLQRPCRPGLECVTPCFIDNKSKQTFCAQTTVCMQPGKPLEVRNLEDEYRPVSYESDDSNGSIVY